MPLWLQEIGIETFTAWDLILPDQRELPNPHRKDQYKIRDHAKSLEGSRSHHERRILSDEGRPQPVAPK